MIRHHGILSGFVQEPGYHLCFLNVSFSNFNSCHLRNNWILELQNGQILDNFDMLFLEVCFCQFFMFIALLTELLPGSGCSVALSIGPSIDGQGILFFGLNLNDDSLHGLNMLMLHTSTTVNDQRKTYTKLCQ